MKTIEVPIREQVSEGSQQLFDQLQKHLGKVPNLYAVVGYSATALGAFLQFDEQLSHGVFTAKEREAIALIVSQVNQCDYCLAAHTLIAKGRGFSLDDTINIRQAEAVDSKLMATLQLAESITTNRGDVEAELLDKFFGAGYDEGALMELIGLVTVSIFTNYVFTLTNFPVDFPAAPVLNKAMSAQQASS